MLGLTLKNYHTKKQQAGRQCGNETIQPTGRQAGNENQ